MDAERFDFLVRALVTGVSRRRALQTLAGGVAGGSLLAALDRRVAGAQGDAATTASGSPVSSERSGVMHAYTITGGGGIRLHVEEVGNPSGQPVLFLHGLSQCHLTWRKQLDSDLADDLRLVAMDLRGHGLSDQPRDAYGDGRLWADDVRAVIEALGLDRPILSGWSYGGPVICDYLRAYGEDRIGGVHLVGVSTKLGSEAALQDLGGDVLALVPGLFSVDAEESVRSLEALLTLIYGDLSLADRYLMLGYNVAVPPHVRQALLSRTVDNDDLLGQLRLPVLITHGEGDRVVLPAAAEQHAAIISHAQTSYHPNVGHAPFWEDAERFNQDLRAFAGQVRNNLIPSDAESFAA